MDTIEFYYKNEKVGEAPLPEGTHAKDRHEIAKSAGVKIYDRMCFVDDKGVKRVDSVDVSPQSLFEKEFNVEII